jgi:hypothetical protein
MSYLDPNKGPLTARAKMRQDRIAQATAAREMVKDALDVDNNNNQRRSAFRRAQLAHAQAGERGGGEDRRVTVIERGSQQHMDLLGGDDLDVAAVAAGMALELRRRGIVRRSWDISGTFFEVVTVAPRATKPRLAGRSPWPCQDSNLGATDYESAALPTELQGRALRHDPVRR